ncbi:MAG TPA: spore coat U domain-containing protein [Anaeromyxobacteraceae bacterium]|jgi:spore coat protein U-like protein|nr:spore coat U domain-containing protein [Anaeromyxobacteraceae bacterium]
MTPRILARALLPFALLCGGPARAASCRIVSTTSLAFTYDVFSASPQQLRGTIGYDCAPPASPSLTLSAGTSGNAAARSMQWSGGADKLLYNVYTDAACTQVWSSQALPGIGQHSQSLTFYACLPALQDVSAGSYADTLTVTINF